MPHHPGPFVTQGTRQDDNLQGTFGADLLRARRGGDVVYTYGGDDRVHAGLGADTVFVSAEGRADVWLGRDHDADTLVIGGNGQEFGAGYGGSATVRNLMAADTIRFADPGARIVAVTSTGPRTEADVTMVVEQLDGIFTLALRDVDLTAGLDPVSRDLVVPDGAAVDPASDYYETFDLAWY